MRSARCASPGPGWRSTSSPPACGARRFAPLDGLMEFQDEAFVLAARPYGETGAIVDLLTARHGRWAAHVAGGASRKMKPFLQAGAPVPAGYRARTAEQLGAATLEPEGGGASALFDDPLALAGLAAPPPVASRAPP